MHNHPKPVIYVVDDDQAMRDSLRFLLSTAGYTVVTCKDAEAFLQKCQPDKPGCILLDVRMPGMDGIQLQNSIVRSHGILPIIFMTGHGNVKMAVDAMKTGAVEFLQKPFEHATLLNAVKKAVSCSVQRFQKGRLKAVTDKQLAHLTPREIQTFHHLVEGKTNREAAASMSISVRTVEAHRAKIMRKLGAKNLSDLVKLHIKNS